MKISPISIRSILCDRDFVKGTKLEKITGEESLKNMVEHPFVNRVGLALAGFEETILDGRLHLIGYSEINYLKTLNEKEARGRIENIFKKNIPGIIISSDLTPPNYLIDCCKKANVALLKSPFPSNLLIAKFVSFLSRYLMERKSFHGTLMDIFGVGVLIIGRSGIGKSESSLELIAKGHRLIGDDYISLRKDISGAIIGEVGKDWTSGVMEIKSIGIINVNQIFGLSSWEKEKEVKVVIELKDMEKEEKALDLKETQYKIFDNSYLPCFTINVVKGRNLALIIEVAVKVFLLKQLGIDFQDSFLAFQERLCLGDKNENK